MNEKETKLVYVGDFYFRSKTFMSCIYTEDDRRYDWGFVQRDLAEGKTITIRQANPDEVMGYVDRLTALREAWAREGKL